MTSYLKKYVPSYLLKGFGNLYRRRRMKVHKIIDFILIPEQYPLHKVVINFS